MIARSYSTGKARSPRTTIVPDSRETSSPSAATPGRATHSVRPSAVSYRSTGGSQPGASAAPSWKKRRCSFSAPRSSSSASAHTHDLGSRYVMQSPLDTASPETLTPRLDPYQMGARTGTTTLERVIYRRTAATSNLLIEDMPADPGDGLFASRPVGLDMDRMKVQGTLQHRRLSPVVDRFGHLPGAFPFLASRRGYRIEFRPRKGADVALAERIPVFLIDDAANRSGVTARGLAVHRDFGHGILTCGGFAARFEIHVPGKASQIPPVVLMREDRLKSQTERRDDQADGQDEHPQALVRRVPAKAQLIPPARREPGEAGRKLRVEMSQDHIFRIDSRRHVPSGDTGFARQRTHRGRSANGWQSIPSCQGHNRESD